MPAYYAGPLRRGLTRMGAGNLATTLIPETLDNCLSYSVLNYLKRLKNQAKVEYEKTLGSSTGSKGLKGVIPEGIKVTPRSPFKKELLTNHLLKDKFTQLRDQLTDFPGFLLGIKDTTIKGASSGGNRFRNPFDIPRKSLLDQIVRMRANYLQPSVTNTKLVDEDSRHSLPISQMGNYQDYLKNATVPLREIESTPVRQHMFGNPFKINKNMIMDEVDEVVGLAGNNSPNQISQNSQMSPNNPRAPKRPSSSSASDMGGSGGGSGAKRKKGALPRDFVYRKTPQGTPRRERTSSDSDSSLQNNALEESILKQVTSHLLSTPVSPQVQSTPPPTLDQPPTISTNGPTTGETSSGENNVEEAAEEAFSQIRRSSSFMLSENSADDITNQILNSLETSNLEAHSRINGTATAAVASNGNVHLNGTIRKNKKRERSPVPPRQQQPSMIKAEVKVEPKVEGLTKEELKSVQLRNQNIRQIIYKEVKRPGKNHDRLMTMLKNDLHGPPSVRREYICDVIREADRFKRRSLAELLEKRMEELVQPAPVLTGNA